MNVQTNSASLHFLELKLFLYDPPLSKKKKKEIIDIYLCKGRAYPVELLNGSRLECVPLWAGSP